MSLSVSAAWDETAATARREGWRLFGLAFLLLSLPGAVLGMLAPVTVPGQLPHIGLWLLGVPILVTASLAGALAISGRALGLGPRAALGGILPLLGAALLVALGVAALLVLLAFVPTAGGLSLLAAAVLLLLAWARLLLLTPAAAAERLGPIGLFRRSWALTRGQLWRLLGFLVVVVAVSLVVAIAVGAIGGIFVTLAAGRPEPGSLAHALILLITALVQAAISGLFTIFVARLYAQLVEA